MTDLAFLNRLRELELEAAFGPIHLPFDQLSVLEIGSGTGQQLQLLSMLFSEARGLEIADAGYKQHRMANIIEYDGSHFPFPDHSFDVVFSSNTLEHIPHLDQIAAECKRVLKPGGICVHILPTATWKIWTFVTHYLSVPQIILQMFRKKKQNVRAAASGSDFVGVPKPKRSIGQKIIDLLVPALHGERGNTFSEIWYFRPAWWRATFRRQQWHLRDDYPVGYFYTGYTFLGGFLSFAARKNLSKILGSSCHVFILEEK